MVLQSAQILAIVFASYLGLGVINDRRLARRERAIARVTSLLAAALYEPHSDVGPIVSTLQQLSKNVLLDVALRLSLELDSDANRRLVDIVATTGLTRRIRRLSGSRRSRTRYRAARLAHLLPVEHEIRNRLLRDPHVSVRKKTVETLGPDHLAEHAPALLEMLEEEAHFVAYTAQQALLRSDGRVLAAIEAHLSAARGAATARVIEVAAYFRDARLFAAIAPYSTASDPRLRSLVAHALPAGSVTQGFDVLSNLLADPEPRVRLAAVRGIARLRIDRLAAKVGALLADRSWEVRREAGEALEELGPAGTMVLRAALDHPDRFARDMARQVLDAMQAGGRFERVPAREELRGLDQWTPVNAA
ncbi:MAG: HEAT repeat domain-containing protein [Acidimicrobiales bacterium]